MVPWYHGTMAPWYPGTMAPPWYHGTMVIRPVPEGYQGPQQHHGVKRRGATPLAAAAAPGAGYPGSRLAGDIWYRILYQIRQPLVGDRL